MYKTNSSKFCTCKNSEYIDFQEFFQYQFIIIDGIQL